MSIGDLILNNEKKLLNNIPQYERIIKAFIIKIEKITFDANIIDFCKKSYDIPTKKTKFPLIINLVLKVVLIL